MQMIESSARAPQGRIAVIEAVNALASIARAATAGAARAVLQKAEQQRLPESQLRELRNAVKEREHRDGLARSARDAARRGLGSSALRAIDKAARGKAVSRVQERELRAELSSKATADARRQINAVGTSRSKAERILREAERNPAISSRDIAELQRLVRERDRIYGAVEATVSGPRLEATLDVKGFSGAEREHAKAVLAEVDRRDGAAIGVHRPAPTAGASAHLVNSGILLSGQENPISRGSSLTADTLYELEVGLALEDKGTRSGNGDKELRIDRSQDNVWYGVKHPVTLQDGRRTTCESDVFVFRHDGTRVGIDAKHARDSSYKATVTERQLDAVVEAIASGQVQEFHFVTNGRFAQRDRNSIEAANTRCLSRLAEVRAVATSKPPGERTITELKVVHGAAITGPLICWHEEATRE